MAHFVAVTSTQARDYGLLAAPEGFDIDATGLAAYLRRCSNEARKDLWVIAAKGEKRLVGLFTTNARYFGDDSQFAKDPAGRNIASFFAWSLDSGESVPSFSVLENEFADDLKAEAQRVIAEIWRRPGRTRTSVEAHVVAGQDGAFSDALDIAGLAVMKCPDDERELLWERARATTFRKIDGLSLIILNAVYSASTDAFPIACLCISGPSFSAREEVVRSPVEAPAAANADAHRSRRDVEIRKVIGNDAGAGETPRGLGFFALLGLGLILSFIVWAISRR